jgi:hypothetical protein
MPRPVLPVHTLTTRLSPESTPAHNVEHVQLAVVVQDRAVAIEEELSVVDALLVWYLRPVRLRWRG